MMEKYKILAVIGQAGSGKSSFVDNLIKMNKIPDMQPIISCTTRPIRENEQDGIDYHFLTNEQFAEQVVNGEMLEAIIFNDWCYGTSLKNLNPTALNIGVFNPEGVEILRGNPNIDLKVIYLIANDKVRLLRQLNREENPDCKEIIRRYGTDAVDFRASRIEAIAPDYVLPNNGNYTINELTSLFAIQYLVDKVNK